VDFAISPWQSRHYTRPGARKNDRCAGTKYEKG
jgi:hypothetical protein